MELLPGLGTWDLSGRGFSAQGWDEQKSKPNPDWLGAQTDQRVLGVVLLMRAHVAGLGESWNARRFCEQRPSQDIPRAGPRNPKHPQAAPRTPWAMCDVFALAWPSLKSQTRKPAHYAKPARLLGGLEWSGRAQHVHGVPIAQTATEDAHTSRRRGVRPERARQRGSSEAAAAGAPRAASSLAPGPQGREATAVVLTGRVANARSLTSRGRSGNSERKAGVMALMGNGKPQSNNWGFFTGNLQLFKNPLVPAHVAGNRQ